ncbi:TraB/GumN family protein [Chryseosolibacter indicus]|uniref:TraB/GumN family protein n=1 Tax=Chryseosolibacter indicus TaxID=2782351 RepID=A0ABS5VXT0_9BACT|nr:TraB/GumN family protein [Chryseosolibacter indicus]MBT1706210.1 TraB/GumN family protein [Chryseosolibacter indicus]
MKQLFLAVITIATAVQLTSAQTRAKNSLLWEISGNGLKHSSYIFGSLHLIDTTEFMLPHEVFRLMEKCSKLAVEMDITDRNLLSRLDFSRATKGEEGKSLMSDLDNTYQEKLEKILGIEKNNAVMMLFKNGIDDDMNPYYLTNMITVAAQMRSINNNYPMDLELIKHAKRENKTVTSLETPEEQMLGISGNMLTWEEKMVALRKSIDEYLQDSLSSKKLYEAYRKQNLEELIGDLRDTFFVQRNQNMVTRMTPLIKESSTFVVIGAAHLPFENGVLQLLRYKGFTVRPVHIDLIQPKITESRYLH